MFHCFCLCLFLTFGSLCRVYVCCRCCFCCCCCCYYCDLCSSETQLSCPIHFRGRWFLISRASIHEFDHIVFLVLRHSDALALSSCRSIATPLTLDPYPYRVIVRFLYPWPFASIVLSVDVIPLTLDPIPIVLSFDFRIPDP